MKITIRGDDITPEKVAYALRQCEKDHGLKISGLTIYARMTDSLGRCCDPLSEDGREISREFAFRKPREAQNRKPPSSPAQPDPVDPISAREMMAACAKVAHRALSSPEMKTLQTIEQLSKPNKPTSNPSSLKNSHCIRYPFLRSSLFVE